MDFGCMEAEDIPMELREYYRELGVEQAQPLTKFNQVISPRIETIQSMRLVGTEETSFGNLAADLKAEPGRQLELNVNAVVKAPEIPACL